MAIRSKTPSTPAKRGKNTASPDAPAAAPAKTRTKRNGSAAGQPEAQNAPVPNTAADTAIQQQTFEAPAEVVERQPAAAKASSGHEDRTNRALDAIRTLGEMIAEGIGTLGELRAEMRQMSGRLDQLAASRPNAGSAQPDRMADTDDDHQAGRDRDPGDAVPPGVAAMSPAPLTDTDESALHSLEELPRRAGRGKRGPRAKA